MHIQTPPPKSDNPYADRLAKQIDDFAIESLIRLDDAPLRALKLPSGVPRRPDEPAGRQRVGPAGSVEAEAISPEMLRAATAELSRHLVEFDTRAGNEAALAAFIGRHAHASSLPGAKTPAGKQSPSAVFSATTALKPAASGTRPDKAWVSRRFG